jgi:mRNA interferase MazF
MAEALSRGEIRMFRFARPDKRRPVLVLSRDSVIEALHTVTVAAITSTLHGSPTEVELGVAEGLKGQSSVNLANVFTVRQSDVGAYVGALGPQKMALVCQALSIAVGCD